MSVSAEPVLGNQQNQWHLSVFTNLFPDWVFRSVEGTPNQKARAQA